MIRAVDAARKLRRPVREDYVSPVEKVQNILSEATMSVGQLKKRDNIKVLQGLIDNQKPVETKDHGSTTIAWIDNKYKISYESGDLESAFPRNTPVFITPKGEKLKISDIIKADYFGGGKGSGGGSSGTTAAESAQCVYCQAIWNNPKTDFNMKELQVAFSQVKVDATWDMIENLSDDWVDSSSASARALYRALKKRKYTWHRGSDWVDTLNDYFKSSGQTYFSDINKWTPADVWAIDEQQLSKYDFGGGVGLPYLNELLIRAYAARDIIGISLKKTSKVKFSQQNYRKPFKEPKFTKTSLGKRDFFSSKDGYIFGESGLQIQFRTFPAFQGEIIGGKAKHGKISGDAGSSGPIGLVMMAAGANPIPRRKEIEGIIKKDIDKFMQMFHKEYQQSGEKNMSIEEFTKKLKGKNSNWLESKYLVTLMFNELKGKEQKFLELAYRYAKSESKQSAVHLKVY
jgi:hypothetical protein